MRRTRRPPGITRIVTAPIGNALYEAHSTPRNAIAVAPRNPLVDQLLPEGASGTHFVASIGDEAGEAFAASAAIALASDPEKLGDTAKNSREHFAEMAATAWSILVPPSGMCYIVTPAERLREVEINVPGTAGFVVRFLNLHDFADLDGRADVLVEASALSASQRAEWTQLWASLDRHRTPSGEFIPWPPMSVRAALAAQRNQLRNSPDWLDRIMAPLLLPSMAVAAVVF